MSAAGTVSNLAVPVS